MKRILIVLLFIALLTFSGCRANLKEDIPYPEIPITENMKLETTKDRELIGSPNQVSTFTVEGQNISNFLASYAIFLEENNWSVIEQRNPNTIVAQQGDFRYAIVAYENDSETKVDIVLESNNE